MKELNQKEAAQLEELLKRAISNGQFGLRVASPYPEGEDWQKDGWAFNDMHNGIGVNSDSWNVEMSVCDYDDHPTDPKTDRPEVAVFIEDELLCHLVGISQVEADAVIAARKARSAKGGKATSAAKTKAARKNWKKALEGKKAKGLRDV